jgi:predicted phosphodiesterase
VARSQWRIIDRARSLPNARFLLGNADRLDEPNVSYHVALLREDQREFIAGFPEQLVIEEVLYRHGSPRSVDELVSLLTPDEALREMLEGLVQRTVVIGHTHTQFDRQVDDYQIINAGSVGAAWETTPGAYWALITDGDVQLRRTQYDVAAAVGALRLDYPNREIRTQWIQGPHDPHAIAQQIETAARR